MARLRDVGTVVGRVGAWSFFRRVWRQVGEDNIFVWAAALAYSWLFAIFPFFIFLLALVPYLPASQKQEVFVRLNMTIDQSLPHETANLMKTNINQIVDRMLNQSHKGFLSMGLLVSLWAASGGMAMTMSALDRCYDIDINRPIWKQRPIAIFLTAVVTTLILLVVFLLPIGTVILDLLWKYAHLPSALHILLNIARWALAVVLMVMVLNIVYHFGTQVKQPFRFVTPGAVFSIVMWIVLGLSFRLYVDRFAIHGYDKTYGTVGGVVILLFLFYVDALVLLIGAEINSEIDFEVLGIPNGTLDFRAKPPVTAADVGMPSP